MVCVKKTYITLSLLLLAFHCVCALPPDPVPVKEWNFLVYMCNNNNLHRYGLQNFKEMTAVGSSSFMNILLQMDEFNEKKIQRLYIEKNNPITIETHSDTELSYSGTPENLFKFAEWGIQGYQAQKNCLVLWNHGSGIKDPNMWGRMVMWLRDSLFKLDSKTGLLKLNRSSQAVKGMLKTLALRFYEDRGIAFNEKAESYINNQGLKSSLSKICTELLGGKKIDVLAMDACHMAMIEVASQVKDSAIYLVASEEIEPGAGYHYDKILGTLKQESYSSQALAQHIVTAYNGIYNGLLGDYTQSAVDLRRIGELENVVSAIAVVLKKLLDRKDPITLKIIQYIRRSYQLTTEFLDDDYIDLAEFFRSVSFQAQEYANKKSFILPREWEDIDKKAQQGLELLQEIVVANVAGPHLSQVGGLSIYFPTASIHPSYYKTDFAQSTQWVKFLEVYMRVRRSFKDD